MISVPDHLREIHVWDVLPDSVLAELNGLDATAEPAMTVESGRLQDEAALHGVLNRLHLLGLHLVEARRRRDTQDAPQ